MTNNVNFTGSTYYSPYDIQNLAKYATGVAISHQPVITGDELMSGATGNLAIQGMSWLKDNKGHYAETLKSQASAAQQMTNLYKAQDTFVKGAGAVMNASSSVQLLGMIPDAEKLSKMSQSTQNLFRDAKIAAEHLGTHGTKQAYQTANQLLCQANAAAAKEAVANATGFWGKAKNFLGINKASAAINTAAAGSTVGSACLNEFKAQGGPVMLAIEGATETITNVIPTFKQLGAKAGMKQVGKSSVKTVASVGGWVAGAAVGTKVGALIGSVIPGAGTAVGAVVGAAIGSICSLIGGTLGSKLAKAGAEKVVGKDELVLAQEKQAAQLAQAATVDSQVLGQVQQAATERLQAEGTDTKDAQIAFNSLNSLSSGTSVAGMTQTPSTQQASTTTNPFGQTAMPSFGANYELLAKYGLS